MTTEHNRQTLILAAVAIALGASPAMRLLHRLSALKFRSVILLSGIVVGAWSPYHEPTVRPPEMLQPAAKPRHVAFSSEIAEREPRKGAFVLVSSDKPASEVESDSGDKYDREATAFLKLIVGVIGFAVFYALSRLF